MVAVLLRPHLGAARFGSLRSASVHTRARGTRGAALRYSLMGRLNEYYRARIAECERQAEQTKDERIREQYRLLAEHWRLLAELFDKHGL